MSENAGCSYFVFYSGKAESPEAFLRYYRDVHVPLLLEWPEALGVFLHVPESWSDPFPVHEGEFALIAQIVFPTPAALNRALTSDARKRARDDFGNFPKFAGNVRHQAMSTQQFRAGVA